MLYTGRFRIKEAVRPDQLGEINRLFDTELIPAAREVQGVRSFQAYNSNTGEMVWLLEVDNLATVDRLLEDRNLAPILGRLTTYLTRTGGEILFDRPAWQGLYGRT